MAASTSLLQAAQPYDWWLTIVSEYARRELSVATDVLPALSGLAQMFYYLHYNKYYAGIWEGDLLRSLMWMREALRMHDQAQHRSAPPTYRVPSWSWAGVRGRIISWLHPPADDTWFIEEQAKVLGAKAHTPGNKYSHTSGGHLTIEARFRPIYDISNADSVGDTVLERAVAGGARVDAFRSEFEQQHQAHDGQMFAVILMSRHHRGSYRESQSRKRWTKFPSIVLMVIESTGRADEFRRVGMFKHDALGSSADDRTGMEVFQEMDEQKWERKQLRLI